MKIKLLLGLVLIVLVVSCAWQVMASEIANLGLQEDMHDMAAQVGSSIGLAAPQSEDDLRRTVLTKARSRDIDLNPEQVTVRVTMERHRNGDKSIVFLAADYTVPVSLPGYAFTLHFTPSSEKRFF
jgi:hypothetical protein